MYSLAHVHLLLNHFPILVTLLGLLLVAVAAVRRRDDLARVSLWFFIGGALSALPTYLTGEPAAHTVRALPGVAREFIEEHQDAALIAALTVGVLGLFALWALWRYRRPLPLPRWVVQTALVGALVGSGAMAWTGLLGGEIHHPEVRVGFVAPR